MIILALDTTGPDCSVCLSEGAAVLAYTSERIGRGHAERLAPMVADAFTEAGLSPEAVKRVAVCTGPGSFTGLRVALSLAKGFALPSKLPVLGIDALQIEAARLNTESTAVFRDVKRGQVFAAVYRAGQSLALPEAMTIEQAETLAAAHGLTLLPVETVDVRVLTQLAATLDPADYPANPLYARAPDAKLPGGVTLPAA